MSQVESTSAETEQEVDSSRWAVGVSALVGVVVAFLSVWWASGFTTLTETLFRVEPTVEDGGIGAEWVASNTDPLLDFLIAVTHAADVIMGVFILVMLFVHWSAFRRLAGRMQPSTEGGQASSVTTEGTGGSAEAATGESAETTTAGTEASSTGGEPE